MGNVSDYIFYTLQNFKEKFRNDLHTCIPCTVVEVIGSRVNVQPIIKGLKIGAGRTIRLETGEYVQVEDYDLPPILDCPIQMLVTSKGRITIPVSIGDQGLLIICERDIRNWKKSGSSSVASIRKFNQNDGVFLPFINQTVSSYDTTSIDIEYEGSKIKLNSSGIKITGNVEITGTLKVSSTAEITGDAKINGLQFMSHRHLYTPGTGTPTDTGTPE